MHIYASMVTTSPSALIVLKVQTLRQRRTLAANSMASHSLTRRRGPSERDADTAEERELLARSGDDSPAWSGDELPQPGKETATAATGETFVITKHILLRLLGAVYLFAFIGAYLQNGALLGERGLMPAKPHFEALQRDNSGSPLDGFLATPSVYWWLPLTDASLDGVAMAGVALSALVCVGVHSSLVMLALWLLYFSVVTVADASSFYSYGWESQLLETGFLAVFLPLLERRDADPSRIVLWLFRWLSFRISLGAGLIKVRGGSCWEARTCLHYHFETQPIPSPASFVFHFLPKWALSHAVDLDLLVQLYASWTVLVPGVGWPLRWLRRAAGVLQVGFMLNIAASGNFAFLNQLTIIPSLACLDDACWQLLARACPRPLRAVAALVAAPCRAALPSWSPPQQSLLTRGAYVLRRVADLALLGVIGWLSWPVVANLLQLDGRHQVMNGSFGSFRLVNTYGAFGSVGEARYEPIVSLSHDGVSWHEIDFPCKPGNVTRRPCFCAPYHYRLDWNIWFIGFKPHQAMLQQRERWLYALLAQLLADGADAAAVKLLDASAADGPAFRDPRPPHAPRKPRLAKVDMYHYEMAEPLWTLAARWWRAPAAPLTWWKRTLEEELVPVVALDPKSGNLHRVATR